MPDIKYYPQDRKNSGTLGIKLPANADKGTSNSGLFNMSYTTEEQAVSNYINLLLTRRGERYMQPEYGIGIQEQLFEQNTDFLQDLIESEIRLQTAIWLPYIDIKNLVVKTPTDSPGLNENGDHNISISITFSVTENGANIQITFFDVHGKIQYGIS